jgi:UDPglucose 6-dehydrogenase
MQHITVIGTGYVGLVSGAGISDFGHKVICADIIAEKIENLKRGIIPIYEPGLKELVNRNVDAGRLSFTTNIPQAIKSADVVFIAVGTPEKQDGKADLTAVESVARSIGENINYYKVICTKSTVPINTGEKICKIIEENNRNNVEFDYVSNPEFLREGAAVKDFMLPDRVIIGASSDRAFKIMREVYRPLYINETPMLHTSVKTAETIKYASNAFLALKISYINEIANLCEAVDADVHVVAKGMGIDGRISPKFLHPGPGYGGSCFPKDTKALVSTAEELKSPMRTVTAAIETNALQKKRMVKKLFHLLDGKLKGKRIAVLGLSFKPQTDDVRESPAIEMIKALLDADSTVSAYDPVAYESMQKLYPNIEYHKSWEKAVKGCHAAVIMTEWNEFRGLNIKKLKDLMLEPILLDTRNILNMHELIKNGFKFDNVGRHGMGRKK